MGNKKEEEKAKAAEEAKAKKDAEEAAKKEADAKAEADKADSKPEEKKKAKMQTEYIAIRDINKKIRKGDQVPLETVLQWKKMGIKTELMVV